MAITTYAELQTAIGNWLNRSDLTDRIPEFIVLAEADMRRQLRDVKAVSSITLTAAQDYYDLATSVKEVESLRYDMSDKLWPLRQKSPAGLAEIRRSGSGTPQAFAVVGSKIYFDVTPDDDYTMELTYIGQLTALASGVNSTLTNSPDIYLYGALAHSAPFLEHDERVATWQQQYEAAIAKENIYRERQEFGATPEAHLPVVFGEDDGT